MNTFKKPVVALLIILGSLSFSLSAQVFAHGDDDHHASAQTEYGKPGKVAKVTRTIEVSMGDNMRFTPDTLMVKQGETIRIKLINKGNAAHEFVLGTSEEIAEHAEMMRQMPDMVHTDASAARAEAGKEAEIIWKFNKAGSFVFACLIPGHSEAGMRGSVTVVGVANKNISKNTAVKNGSATSASLSPSASKTVSIKNTELSKGEILKVDSAQIKLTIKHGELKNLNMPGMTMIFRLKDSAWINQYKAGDKIRFLAEKKNGNLIVTHIELEK